MSSDILIRRLEPSDSIDDLTSLIHRAFAALGRMGLGCTGVEQSLDSTVRRVRRGECHVAVVGGRIAGTMTLEAPDTRSETAWYRRHDVATVHQFAVDPRDQGRGCGQAMLEAAVRWARARGYAELALETPADAAHLVDFYKAQGFRPVGHLRKADKSYVSVVLSRPIAVPRPRPRARLTAWFAPHRLCWTGLPARRAIRA